MITYFANITGVAVLLIMLFFTTVAGCKGKSEFPGKDVRSIPSNGELVQLTLIGYNYTDRYIDQFSADGAGGGNLFVSGPGGGGGGRVCCVAYIVGSTVWKTTIRWQTDACTYNNEIDTNGQRLYEIYSYFKENDILVNADIPARPQYFEVHFYPDGHVEAAITEKSSLPRLNLPRDREDRTGYKQCKNNKKPEIGQSLSRAEAHALSRRS